MDSGKLVRMPNQPATPAHSIRVPDELWADSRFIAQATGYSGVSQMTREDFENRREAYEREHGPIDRSSDEYRAAQRG